MVDGDLEDIDELGEIVDNLPETRDLVVLVGESDARAVEGPSAGGAVWRVLAHDRGRFFSPGTLCVTAVVDRARGTTLLLQLVGVAATRWQHGGDRREQVEGLLRWRGCLGEVGRKRRIGVEGWEDSSGLLAAGAAGEELGREDPLLLLLLLLRLFVQGGVHTWGPRFDIGVAGVGRASDDDLVGTLLIEGDDLLAFLAPCALVLEALELEVAEVVVAF